MSLSNAFNQSGKYNEYKPTFSASYNHLNLIQTFHLGDQTLDLSVPLVLFDAVLRKQTLVVYILEGSDALQRFRDALQHDVVEGKRRVYTVRSDELSVKPEVEEHSFKTVEPLERG